MYQANLMPPAALQPVRADLLSTIIMQERPGKQKSAAVFYLTAAQIEPAVQRTAWKPCGYGCVFPHRGCFLK